MVVPVSQKELLHQHTLGTVLRQIPAFLSTCLRLIFQVPQACGKLLSGHTCNHQEIEQAICTKMRAALCLGKLTEELKLTYKEFTVYRQLAKDNTHVPLFKSYEKLLTGSNGPFIRVCLFRLEREGESQENFFKSCARKVFSCLANLLYPYGHTNFLVYDGQKYTKHGQGNTVCLYHKEISGLYTAGIDTFDINPDAIMPSEISEEKKAAFRTKFFENLTHIITKEGEELKYPRIGFLRYLCYNVIPTCSEKLERYLEKRQVRESFCSEFVAQAIMEAHARSCEAFCLRPPATVDYFGLSHAKGLAPYELKRKFVAKGIFIPRHSAIKHF